MDAQCNSVSHTATRSQTTYTKAPLYTLAHIHSSSLPYLNWRRWPWCQHTYCQHTSAYVHAYVAAMAVVSAYVLHYMYVYIYTCAHILSSTLPYLNWRRRLGWPGIGDIHSEGQVCTSLDVASHIQRQCFLKLVPHAVAGGACMYLRKYVYVCMCVCIYIYTHTQELCLRLFLHIQQHHRDNVSSNSHGVPVYMYVCMYVCMGICM